MVRRASRWAVGSGSVDGAVDGIACYVVSVTLRILSLLFILVLEYYLSPRISHTPNLERVGGSAVARAGLGGRGKLKFSLPTRLSE